MRHAQLTLQLDEPDSIIGGQGTSHAGKLAGWTTAALPACALPVKSVKLPWHCKIAIKGPQTRGAVQPTCVAAAVCLKHRMFCTILI
jgi:hypothetical protein